MKQTNYNKHLTASKTESFATLVFVEASLQIFFIVPYYTTIRALPEFEAAFIVDMSLKAIRVFKFVKTLGTSIIEARHFLARETRTMS